MKSVVVGASSGLGRAIAEKLAERGDDMYLLARDRRDLDPLARDFTIRFGTRVIWNELDLSSFDAPALVQRLLDEMGGVDNVFLVAGLGSDDDAGSLPDAQLRMLIEVNYVALTRIANAFLDHLASRPKANLVGIGSVGAVRGRNTNMVYASAKRGLETYFEALRHCLAATGCRVQFYRAGFMLTTMLGNRRPALPAATPEAVAARIVANLDRDLGTIYVPGWWRWIGLALRLLPWVIFKRLSI